MKCTLQFFSIIALCIFCFFSKINAQNAIHEIKGNVVLDANSDCIFDAADTALENWFLRVDSGNESFSVETDVSGFYHFFVPNGSYDVQLLPLNTNFSVCGTNLQSVSFSGNTPQSATFDFVAEKAFFCPRLRTEISASNVQPCEVATIDVFYRNDGTEIAENAQIFVSLDQAFSLQSASIPPSFGSNNFYTFDIGDIPEKPGSTWGKIEIKAKLDCSILNGTPLNLHSSLEPNDICSTSSNWSGAVIVASGSCGGNLVLFSLKNIGTAPSSFLEYIIVEDQIVLREETYQLNPGATLDDTITVMGQVASIIAEQEPNFPGDSIVAFTVYNCNGTSQNTTAFPSVPGPSSHQEGVMVRTQAETTEKSAYPIGYGMQNTLKFGTPIEYRIPFQNNTNVIVQTVVIRDTLDADLDFEKVELRGSSHSVDFTKIADNVLQFTFNNIQLPPVNSNPQQASGYVEFLIYPKPNLLSGTEIINEATVYFNQSFFTKTNTVRRQYEMGLLVQTIDYQPLKKEQVKIYPNPFVEKTTFELSDSAPFGAYRLVVFDGLGRTIHTAFFEEKTYTVAREHLAAGLLFWRIEQDGKMVQVGKFVVQR